MLSLLEKERKGTNRAQKEEIETIGLTQKAR